MTDKTLQTTALTTAGGKPVEIATGGILSGIAPQSIDEAFRLSQALARAGDMVPSNFQGKPEEIMAAILRGAEVGLMPMQALSNIAVINGRACIWGDALPALMLKAGHKIDVEVTGEGDDMVATATLIRKDGQKIVREFSVADAKRANLWQTSEKVTRRKRDGSGTYETGNDSPWYRYPKRMLSMRARAWACRDGAADALMGLQVIEEMQDAPPPMRDVTPKPEPGGFAARAQAARQGDTVLSGSAAPATVDVGDAEPADEAGGPNPTEAELAEAEAKARAAIEAADAAAAPIAEDADE